MNQWTDEKCIKFASIAFRHAPKNLPEGVTLDDIRMAAARVIAELGQEVGAVAGRVETGVVQFGDDWPGVFIRGDNAFATAMHLRGEDSVWRNAAIKSLAELLESCNVANNPNVRVLSSPAHTSEARDAKVVELIAAAENHMNAEPMSWQSADAFKRLTKAIAAMRQEGGSDE